MKQLLVQGDKNNDKKVTLDELKAAFNAERPTDADRRPEGQNPRARARGGSSGESAGRPSGASEAIVLWLGPKGGN